MSGVLRRLAVRNFGFTPAIRPRLAAMFEPAASTVTHFSSFIPQAAEYGALSSSQEVEGQAVHTDRSSPQALVTGLSVRDETQTGPADPLPPMVSLPRSDHKLDSRAIPFGQNLGTEQDDPEISQVISSQFRLNPTARSVRGETQPHDPTVLHRRPNEPRSAGERLQADTGISGEDRINLKDFQPKKEFLPVATNSPSVLADEEIAVPRAKTRAIAFSSVLGEGELNPATIEAQVRRSTRKKPERAVTETQSGLEPAIQVTIGRIEVRAAAAHTTSGSVPRRQSTVMGLDEYLRQQAKRGGQ